MKISFFGWWIITAFLMFLLFYGVILIKGVMPSMGVIERAASEESRQLDHIQFVDGIRRDE